VRHRHELVPQLLVRHAIELASAARLDLFDLEAPKLPVQALGIDGGAHLVEASGLIP
jgi:hypothetical protein